MKKIRFLSIIIITILLFSGILYAQVPPLSFNYHGVARDASNNIIANTQVGIKLIIMDDFYTTLYTEEFTPTTDQNGSFTVQIGQGSTPGNFSDIDWSDRPNYLNVHFASTAGAPYQDLDTIPFLSVPYSLVTQRIALPYHDSTDQYVKNGDGAVDIMFNTGTDSTAALKGVVKGAGYAATGVLGIGMDNSQYGVIGKGNAGGVRGEGRGSGVWGVGEGYGVVGQSTGPHGVGVYAGAFYYPGIGLQASSFAEGTAAYLEGGKVVIHGDHSNPNLIIERNSGTTGANIRFRISEYLPDYWQIDARNHVGNNYFSISNTGVEMLRIKNNGSIKFNGALMPNDMAGNAGQVLTSAGPGAAPVWTNPGTPSFNNTYLYDQWGDFIPPYAGIPTDIPWLSQNVFNVNGTCKVLVELSIMKIVNAYNAGGGNAKVRVEVELRYAPSHPTFPGALINRVEETVIVPNGETGSVNIDHHCYLTATGPLEIRVKAVTVLGDPDITIKGVGPNNTSNGQMTVQVLPQ